MATIADVRELIPSLPDEPHHPKSFDFPKRSFGKTKLIFVQQRASGSILGQANRQDVMFCNACITTFELGRIKSICKCVYEHSFIIWPCLVSDKRPFSALGKNATVTSVSIYSCVCVHVCAYWGCFIGLGTSLNNNGVVL